MNQTTRSTFPFRGPAHDVVIVGAGLMGAMTALCAASQGLDVALVDRGPLCGAASGVNAGTLTLHMTRTALIPHALRGHALWMSSSQWLGRDAGVTHCPGLCLAYTEAEEALLRERTAARQAVGAPLELIDAARAHALEPGLGDGIRLAAYTETDGHVTAYKTAHAFRKALTSAGVTLYERTAIDGIDRADGSFVAHGPECRIIGHRLVLAGGVWLETMFAWLGLTLPIKRLINQLIVTDKCPPTMRSVITIANGLLSLKQFANGAVLIGGGWQGRHNPESERISLVEERLVGNLQLAAWAIPALRSARFLRAWHGFEAETRDALPILGEIPGVEGAYAIGSVHSGYTSGLAIGELMADILLDRLPTLPIFPIDRLLREEDIARSPRS